MHTMPRGKLRPTLEEVLGLFRQPVYRRRAGYEGVNDADRLARDPAVRAIVGWEGLDRPASSSEMGRFETEWLATEANLAVLSGLSGASIDRVHRRRPPDGIMRGRGARHGAGNSSGRTEDDGE
jgi:hypothetical protein